MKNMKKLASLLLVLVMVFALAVPALATNVTINIDGENPNNETYTVYKIFDATVNGETSKTDETNNTVISEFANVSYSIDSESPFFAVIQNFKVGEDNAFKLTRVNGTTEYTVTMIKEYNAADLATELLAVPNKADVAVLTNEKSGFTIDNKGYYLITSSLGSKAVVDTIGENNMTIKTKNDLPTLDKKITSVTNGKANDGVEATASYGSTVTYTITVNIPASAVGEITVHDKMNANLTYAGMTDVVEGITDKTAELADDCSMEFVLSEAYVAAHLGENVTIVYTATVNGTAPTAEALKNTANLAYSNYTSTPVEVFVKTYEFDLVKTTSEQTGFKLLDGATFQMYSSETDGEAYKFTYDETTKTYSLDADGDADIVVVDGMVTVKGIAAGTYYLEETVTPDGYNPLSARQEVVLSTNSKATVAAADPEVEGDLGAWTAGGVKVVNLTGTELPSTGGIGTTMFYIVGGLLIVGAAVLLVTKKRMSGEEQ